MLWPWGSIQNLTNDLLIFVGGNMLEIKTTYIFNCRFVKKMGDQVNMFEICRFWFPFNLLTSVDQESRFLWWRSVTLSSSNTWGRPGFILRSVWKHKRHFWPPTAHMWQDISPHMSWKEDLWHHQYSHSRKICSFCFEIFNIGVRHFGFQCSEKGTKLQSNACFYLPQVS